MASPPPTPDLPTLPPVRPDEGSWTGVGQWLAAWWDWFVGLPLRIVLIVAVGSASLVVLRHLISSVTNRIATGPAPGTGSSRGERELVAVLVKANPLATARRAQRARTVGSVLRSAAGLLVGTIVVFLVLDSLGINLAPFIASAGIAGVALGIGAQSLVRDFLTGLFMLVEDQYGVGDVIDAGPATGTVEAVGLRVTKLRDDAGTLWFIPNGTMLRVGNKTQEWSTATVEVDVDYFADVDEVRALLLASARRVCAQPDVAPDIQGEPQVTGIERLSAEAVTLKVQVRTSPARQWEVARRLRQDLRQALTRARVPLAGQRDLWARRGEPLGGDDTPTGADTA